MVSFEKELARIAPTKEAAEGAKELKQGPEGEYDAAKRDDRRQVQKKVGEVSDAVSHLADALQSAKMARFLGRAADRQARSDRQPGPGYEQAVKSANKGRPLASARGLCAGLWSANPLPTTSPRDTRRGPSPRARVVEQVVSSLLRYVRLGSRSRLEYQPSLRAARADGVSEYASPRRRDHATFKSTERTPRDSRERRREARRDEMRQRPTLVL